jgi:hypothetical protein
VSAKKGKPRRSSQTRAAPKRADPVPEPRRPFSSALFGSGSGVMPPIGRSLGRGLLTVGSQPVLLLIGIVLVPLAWFALLGLGFEGSPSRLVDVLALPPIATYFDLGTGASIVGIGPAFLIYTGAAIAIRSVVYALLSGLILEALEDGRVSSYGVLRGLAAIPVVIVVQILSFSLIVAGNLIFPVLGPGIGFLGFVAALVGGLFFLGFAPTAAMRQHRGIAETIRRSARAAMLPGGRHLLFCTLYFFVALPVVVGFAPGGSQITANPGLVTWVFALAVNVVHLGFMGALAYRWVVAEPSVPEEPVKRRQPARQPSARGRQPSARGRGRR